MLARNWMSKNVITIDVNETLLDAIKLLQQNDIGRLPVMKKGKLVGIVTDRDVKSASASNATSLEVHELLYLLSTLKIEKIMTKDPITVPPDLTIEEIAQILLKKKISGVPVVDDHGRVVGVITQNDVFKVMISLTGLKERGIQFAFELEDRPGSIKEVTDIIRGFGGRIASILSSYDQAKQGYYKVYIRVYGIDRIKLQALKEKLKEKVPLLYTVDLRENKREIYSLSLIKKIKEKSKK